MGFSPFIEYNGEKEEFFFRPLFSFRPTHKDVKVVWPLFRYNEDERKTSMWLLPFMVYQSRKQENGYDRDFYLLPFFAWGDTPGEGSYFAFFPFGGRLKGFWGKDTFDFVLFPLYMRLRDRDFLSHHVLFPFVNWVSGGGHSGWRFWPFWGRYEAVTEKGTPKYRRWFALWPFFSRQQNLLDTETPSSAWVFFPFYSSTESPNLSQTHIMWPLYAQKEDRKRGLKAWGMSGVPLRFAFSEKEGHEETQMDFWPFYGYWKRPNEFRQFCLWPIQRYEKEDKSSLKAERFWILPFWLQADVQWRDDGNAPEKKDARKQKKSESKETGSETGTATKRLKRRKLWPFFSLEETDAGLHWETLSIFPWFDETTDSFWGRLFHLARYQENARSSAFELLWGLFSSESNAQTSSGVWRVLGGMFGRSHDPGTVTWRIFFIPFTMER